MSFTNNEQRTTSNDPHFMQHAIRMGRRNLGRTWPNPSVGCVLVKDGQVLAATVTAETGRPHAETQALAIAGDKARGATAYVTLEPCSHQGVTPPCAAALIKAEIARVVIGAIDADARVNGQGINMLKQAGVEVEFCFTPEAAALHRGFFRRVNHGMPEVLMKLATSADGQMSDPTGKQRWITSEQARAHGHSLRNQVDALLTGIGTVLADDPMLNVRLPGVTHARLARVIADRRLRLPLESQLVRTAEQQPTWVITTPAGVEQAASHATDLRERGVKFIVLDDGISPHTMLKALAREGITRLLVEAGPALSNAFLASKAVDALYWYKAPTMLAIAGQSANTPLDSGLIEAAGPLHHTTLTLGPDRCEVIEYRACLPD